MNHPSGSARRGHRIPRMVRTAAAALVLGAAAFGFLVAGKAGDGASRAVASWQLFPTMDRGIAAALAGFGGFVACLAALAILLGSALFGRWYCAALCPLGTLQDLASLLGRKRRRFAKSITPLRAAAFVAVLGFAVAGATSLASWLDPWSILSRFFSYDLLSLVRLAGREDLPGLKPVSAVLPAAAVLAILAASFVSGRWFCGNLCPAGAALGALNAVAPLRIRFDAASCVSCGACAKVCRATCVDAVGKSLDATRCVACLACLAVCPTGALRYGLNRRGAPEAAAGAVGMSRGRFLAAVGGGAAAISLLALPGRVFASGASSSEVPAASRQPVLPPGARSVEKFVGACLACGLCVDRCPTRVLQPSFGQLGARGLMVPVLDHGISFCQYDCTTCTEVCPGGALEKLSLERKRLTKIGDATLVRERCVVFTRRTKCGACAESCPTGAVHMVIGETGLPEPVFTSSICIGCGACHHACPARPDRAISVSGLRVQSLAQEPSASLFDAAPGGGSPGEAGSPGGSGNSGDAFPF